MKKINILIGNEARRLGRYYGFWNLFVVFKDELLKYEIEVSFFNKLNKKLLNLARAPPYADDLINKKNRLQAVREDLGAIKDILGGVLFRERVYTLLDQLEAYELEVDLRRSLQERTAGGERYAKVKSDGNKQRNKLRQKQLSRRATTKEKYNTELKIFFNEQDNLGKLSLIMEELKNEVKFITHAEFDYNPVGPSARRRLPLLSFLETEPFKEFELFYRKRKESEA